MILRCGTNAASFLHASLCDVRASSKMDQYTFELFDFAWGTVQARAFGKRLTCSALVPLADCLNHGNVQTK